MQLITTLALVSGIKQCAWFLLTTSEFDIWFVLVLMQPGPSSRRSGTHIKTESSKHTTEHVYPRCNSNSSVPSTASNHNSG